ncbi:MAG: ABC transporter substrate-binding protein [Chloroflexi bacterium OHK40]
MSVERQKGTISRRQFLQLGAVGGVVAATGSLLAGCAAPNIGGGASGPLKIGVLLPYSDIYAALGESITEGMRMYFESVDNRAGGRPIELITEDEGTAPDAAAQKARKLVEQDQVDLVAGIVSSGVAAALRDYFHDNQKFLIIANAGANALTRAAKSPYIFRASFTNWQPNWPMGSWAAANLGRRAFISVPDYGAGKDTISAFTHSFTAAGGEIVKVQLTPFPNIGDPAPFLAEIQAAAPDFVYSFYSGAAAVTFVKAYSDFGLTGSIPLAGSGFMVEQDVLPSHGSSALGIKSALHWALTLDNAENQAFVAAFAQRELPSGNKGANVFAVQGYDTARLIVEALNAVEGDMSRTDDLIGAFGSAAFPSPRGAFKMDSTTHNVINPIYIREVQEVNGTIANVVLTSVGEVPDPGDNSKDAV